MLSSYKTLNAWSQNFRTDKAFIDIKGSFKITCFQETGLTLALYLGASARYSVLLISCIVIYSFEKMIKYQLCV